MAAARSAVAPSERPAARAATTNAVLSIYSSVILAGPVSARLNARLNSSTRCKRNVSARLEPRPNQKQKLEPQPRFEILRNDGRNSGTSDVRMDQCINVN